MSSPIPFRVIAYVDGFNLYFGLKDRGWKRHYWLNLDTLARSFLLPNQQLVSVKYFTARISGPVEKKSRQDVYLEALKTVPSITIFEGQYRLKAHYCHYCRKTSQIPSEKMTDVNVASELLMDAFHETFDTAFVISGDSDLVPPMRHIKESFPRKRIIGFFPPGRASKEISQVAHATVNIGEANLRKSQFPSLIVRQKGANLIRPPRWS